MKQRSNKTSNMPGVSFDLAEFGSKTRAAYSGILPFSQNIARSAVCLTIALFICFTVVPIAQAQSMTGYVFAPTSGTFTPLSGATVQTLVYGDTNNGYYPLAPIGFNFTYNNAVNTQVSASTDGYISVGSIAASQQLNILTYGPQGRAWVAPLWDDLEVNPTSGSVSYQTTGVAPNRVFTMQWLNMEWTNQANTPVISFQVKLYEGTNAIQFVYRQEAGAVSFDGASIGLVVSRNDGSNLNNFISLSDSGTNPSASTTTATTDIFTKPATGQTYNFTPPAGNADLAVTIADAPDPVTAGTNLTYTINLTNNGPNAASTVSLTDTLPANTTFVSLTQNTGPALACTTPAVGGGGTVNCTTASFTNGASASFSLVIKVNAGFDPAVILANTVRTSTGTADLNTANSSATATTTVAAPPPTTFTVTRTDDRNNPDCAAGDCSLREAINASNVSFSLDTIQFSALFDSPQTITLTNGQLTISQGTSILGKGANLTTISGNNSSRVFLISGSSSLNVTISGLTIANGKSGNDGGGGIWYSPASGTNGTVNLTNCAITNNSSTGYGGGINRDFLGTWNITGCTFSGNTAYLGGAIYISSNTTNISNSTFSGNVATGPGGGGGIYDNYGNVSITSSTITANTGSGGTGGVYQNSASGSTTVKNSIIAANFGPSPDLASNESFISNGYNFIGKSDGSFGFTDGVNRDQVGTIASPKNPLLMPLANNGGPTLTHALSAGSPAIDKGFSFNSTTDQRGLTRPVDLAAYPNGTNSDATDIGAYEAQANPATVRSRADFDGDGKTDVSVFRPSDGTWYTNNSTTGFKAMKFGQSGDVVVPGDYDGDGKADYAVFRVSDPSGSPVFYVLNSGSNTVSHLTLGSSGDIPVAGDYDGDGKSDLAVFRPADGNWFINRSSGGGVITTQFGLSGDLPFTMDNDGDGKSNLAVFRPSSNTWYIARSTGTPAQNFDAVRFGTTGDIPVPADYDGDSKEDVAVFRPSNGYWYILRSSDSQLSYQQFGVTGDIAIPGDYDGDGKDDVAVYRNGVWYINRSTSGFTSTNFGTSTDVPVPSKYHP